MEKEHSPVQQWVRRNTMAHVLDSLEIERTRSIIWVLTFHQTLIRALGFFRKVIVSPNICSLKTKIFQNRVLIKQISR